MGSVIPSRYEYTTIKEARTIRLLHLHPGQGDQITFDLQIVSLDDDHVEYETISYCWGDPNLVKPVYCHGQYLDIPQSLHSALKQLRYPHTKDRVLWADSICINQRDNVEKGLQVAMMDLIYSKPTRVLIWLGPDTHDIVGVGESIRQASALLPDEEYEAEELVKKSREFHAGLNDAKRAGLPHFHCHDWAPITNLLCRPWFERKWVIQEVIMASEGIPRVLICGDIDLPWDDLATLGFKLAVYGLTNSIVGMSCLYGFNPSTAASFLQKDGRALLSLNNAMMIKMMSRFRRDVTLRDAIGATGGFKCTDPRDHLYAVLSMPPNRASILPNYSDDFGPADMCMQFAQTTLVSQRDLKVLSLAPHRSITINGVLPSKRLEGLPTWVPDLAAGALVDCLVSYNIRVNLFSAGGVVETPDIKTSGNGKLLHLRGRIIDTVRAKNDGIYVITPLPSEQDIRPKTAVSDRVRMRARNWLVACMNVAYEPAEGVVFWRTKATPEERRTFALTILCEVVGPRDPVTDDAAEATIDFVDYLLDYFDVPGFVFDPVKRARVLEYGGMIEGSLAAIGGCRKFCRTEEGRFCVARCEVEIGDVVCVVTGAEVPYVLRQVGGEGRYVLIGDAYVSGGVMHGDTMVGDRYEEGEIVLE